MSRREDRERAEWVPGAQKYVVGMAGPGAQARWGSIKTTYGARYAHRAISRIIRREERAQRRCWRHEDCRENHELGAACYALRRGWAWAASAVCQGECCVGPVRRHWSTHPLWIDVNDWRVSDGDYVFRGVDRSPNAPTLAEADIARISREMDAARRRIERDMHQRFFSASAPDPMRNRGRR